MRVAQEHLARGQVLELILIRPESFLKWLAARGEPNTALTRLRYVEALAVQQLSGHGGATGGSGKEPTEFQNELA